MLQAIINRTQRSIDTIISKYVTRIIVAVPFVIAVGFATAAAAVKLSQEFGSVVSYSVIAAVFAATGLVAAATVSAGDKDAASAAVNANLDSTGTDGAIGSIDRDLLISSLKRAGPLAAPILARAALRNLPIVLVMFLFFYVLFSQRPIENTQDE